MLLFYEFFQLGCLLLPLVAAVFLFRMRHQPAVRSYSALVGLSFLFAWQTYWSFYLSYMILDVGIEQCPDGHQIIDSLPSIFERYGMSDSCIPLHWTNTITELVIAARGLVDLVGLVFIASLLGWFLVSKITNLCSRQ